jgi:hypothetical protein
MYKTVVGRFFGVPETAENFALWGFVAGFTSLALLAITWAVFPVFWFFTTPLTLLSGGLGLFAARYGQHTARSEVSDGISIGAVTRRARKSGVMGLIGFFLSLLTLFVDFIAFIVILLIVLPAFTR